MSAPTKEKPVADQPVGHHHGYNEQAIGTHLFQQRHMLPHSQPNWQKT